VALTNAERRLVADRFIKVREAKGINQREMADELDISPSYVSEIERAAKEPSKKVLINFQSKFGRSIEWLLLGIDDSESKIEMQGQKNINMEAIIKTQEQKINDLEVVINSQEQKINEMKAIISIKDDKINLQERLIKSQDNELALLSHLTYK